MHNNIIVQNVTISQWKQGSEGTGVRWTQSSGQTNDSSSCNKVEGHGETYHTFLSYSTDQPIAIKVFKILWRVLCFSLLFIGHVDLFVMVATLGAMSHCLHTLSLWGIDWEWHGLQTLLPFLYWVYCSCRGHPSHLKPFSGWFCPWQRPHCKKELQEGEGFFPLSHLNWCIKHMPLRQGWTGRTLLQAIPECVPWHQTGTFFTMEFCYQLWFTMRRVWNMPMISKFRTAMCLPLLTPNQVMYATDFHISVWSANFEAPSSNPGINNLT